MREFETNTCIDIFDCSRLNILAEMYFFFILKGMPSKCPDWNAKRIWHSKHKFIVKEPFLCLRDSIRYFVSHMWRAKFILYIVSCLISDTSRNGLKPVVRNFDVNQIAKSRNFLHETIDFCFTGGTFHAMIISLKTTLPKVNAILFQTEV